MADENLATLSEVALASLALPNLINPVLEKVSFNQFIDTYSNNAIADIIEHGHKGFISNYNSLFQDTLI